jgi:hypothetical protein
VPTPLATACNDNVTRTPGGPTPQQVAQWALRTGALVGGDIGSDLSKRGAQHAFDSLIPKASTKPPDWTLWKFSMRPETAEGDVRQERGRAPDSDAHRRQ